MDIQPQILETLKDNEGNKLTAALVIGLASSIQVVLNELCNKALEEGIRQGQQASAPETQNSPVEKVAAEPVN